MRKFPGHTLPLLVILLGLAGPATSQDKHRDTALFGNLSWRNIGPNRGGRSLGIAGSSRRRMEY
jgi:hypothetical protein